MLNGSCASVMCPRWDSNPHHAAFKAASSTDWDTGARTVGRPGEATSRSCGGGWRGAGGAVEEEQTGAVVDLVLEGAGLEGVGADDDLLTRAGEPAADDDARRALHVAGEVGDAHAALTGLLVAARLDDLGVAQDERAVVGPRLGVRGHVDAEHPRRDADLRGGQTDAAGADPHRGHQVGGQLHGRGRGRVDDLAEGGQHRPGRGPPRAPGPRRGGSPPSSGRPARRPGSQGRQGRSQLVGLHRTQRRAHAQRGGRGLDRGVDGLDVGVGR